MIRKLATIRKISEINAIEGADAIEVATVDGWKVVVKKGEFKVDDFVIFCEIDSWIPHELAPFLSKGKEPREYNGVKGEKLRTVKLRGQISQGLILPFTASIAIKIGAGPGAKFSDYEGVDVTEILGIQRWAFPSLRVVAGKVKGNFPSVIPKTDQERIQNIRHNDFFLDEWEITEKLEGSPMTCYLIDGQFGVCSRNIDLERDENNSFWKVAIEQDIENKMRSTGMDNFTIQGELVGPGVQGNIYNLDKLDYFVYDVYNIQGNEKYGLKSESYLDARRRWVIVNNMGLKNVPVLDVLFEIDYVSKNYLLKMAEGKSVLYDTEREGIVFKSRGDPNKSFKVISNKYLLSEK